MVTLLHFDFPLYMDLSASSLPDAFLFYAKQVITRFSDRVPIWLTFDEPNIMDVVTHSYGVNYNILMAHAKVAHWYKE